MTLFLLLLMWVVPVELCSSKITADAETGRNQGVSDIKTHRPRLPDSDNLGARMPWKGGKMHVIRLDEDCSVKLIPHIWKVVVCFACVH